MAKSKGVRAFLRTGTVEGAFEDARDEIQSLREEIEDWKSSLENNNMEHLDKYSEVEEAYGYLETAADGLNDIELPEAVRELDVSYHVDTRKSANSRSGRMQNALSALSAANSVLFSWHEEDENSEHDDLREVADVAQAMSDAEDECNNVNFPGMY